MPTGSAPNPVKLPLAPATYDASDQNRMRRQVEIALKQASTLFTQGSVHLNSDYYTKLESDARYALISHTHSAAAITSGILAVARGGTGLGVYTLGDFIVALGPSDLGNFPIGSPATYIRSNGTIPAWTAITAPDVGAGAFPGGAYGFAGYVDFSSISIPATPPSNTSRLYSFLENGNNRLGVTFPDGSQLVLTRDNILLAKNKTGGVVNPGTPVFLNAVGGGTPTFDLAKADSQATMPVVGLVYETIANNAIGRVMFAGLLGGLNTNSYSEGDRVYVSPTTAGTLTATEPSYPNVRGAVGTVTRSHPTQGEILVLPLASRLLDATQIGPGTFPSGNYTFAGDIITGVCVARGSNAGQVLNLSGTPTSGTSQFGLLSDFRGSSAATSLIVGYYCKTGTVDASYTVTSLEVLRIVNPVLGSGSTITTAYGLQVESITTGGTNYAIKTNGGLVSLGDALILKGDPGVGLLRTSGAAGSQYGAYWAPSATGASGFAVGWYSAPSLTAGNNNDALRVAQFNAGNFSTGGKTGVEYVGLFVNDVTGGATNFALKTGAGVVSLGDLLQTVASSTSRAGVRIPSGTAPSSPVDGDLWYDGTNLKFRNGGTTRTITWT